MINSLYGKKKRSSGHFAVDSLAAGGPRADRYKWSEITLINGQEK